MTERTVTVQTETEETIEVCDECGLGDGDGTMVTYRPVDNGDCDEMHLHLDCLDDMGVDVPEPLTYGEVARKVNSPSNASTVMVLEPFDVALLLLGAGLLSAAGIVFKMGAVGGAGAAAFFGVICVAAAILYGTDQAQNTVEHIREQ